MFNYELFMKARRAYAEGKPILSDAEYDAMVKYLESSEDEKDKKLLSTLWEDDSSNIDINDGTSFSIRPSDSEYFCLARINMFVDSNISLKYDGVSGKASYRWNGYEYIYDRAVSRGRATENLLDYTESVRKYVPEKLAIDYIGDTILYWGEFVAKYTAPERTLEVEDREYVSPRSAALGVAQVPLVSKELLSEYSFKVFKTPPIKETLTENLEYAKDLGFDVATNVQISIDDLTIESLRDFVDSVWSVAQEEGFLTDGIIVIKDSAISLSSDDGRFAENAIAMKIGPWLPRVYESIVKEIIIQPRRVYGCVKVEIEPTLTQSGATVRVVNVFNPAILIEKNLLPGNPIKFEYKSENSVNIV